VLRLAEAGAGIVLRLAEAGAGIVLRLAEAAVGIVHQEEHLNLHPQDLDLFEVFKIPHPWDLLEVRTRRLPQPLEI